MISHVVRLIATAASQPSISRPPSRSGVIGLPNPLKVPGVVNFGTPEKAQVTELTGRIEIDPQVEWGVVPIEGAVMANRTVLTNDGRHDLLV